jgi:hypothetical protein
MTVEPNDPAKEWLATRDIFFIRYRLTPYKKKETPARLSCKIDRAREKEKLGSFFLVLLKLMQ